MTRSTHPVEQEEVMAYLDGELAAERAAGVAAHLEECAECRGLAAELRSVSQQMTAWQVEPSPARLTENVMEGRKRVTPPPRLRLRRFVVPRWGWVLAGASAAAVMILFLLSYQASQMGWAPPVAPERAKQREQLESKDYSAFSPSLAEPHASGSQGTVGKLPKDTASLDAASSPASGPMIARTASLAIVAKDFAVARAAVERIVNQHHGYIGELSTTSPKEAARTLTATLRIPAPQLDATLAELKALGRAEQETQSGEEVTKQYTDLLARLKNSRATEQRLVDILRQRTGKVSEVLEVEEEIDRVRGEIEQMEAERKSLETRVQFASVQLRVSEEYKSQLQLAPPSTGTRLRNALVEGYSDAAESLLSFALFLFAAGPTLLLWAAVLFWPARYAWRRFRASRLTTQASLEAR
jgi:anti-sigma factor RsiW